jgi:hypothetical protein
VSRVLLPLSLGEGWVEGLRRQEEVFLSLIKDGTLMSLEVMPMMEKDKMEMCIIPEPHPDLSQKVEGDLTFLDGGKYANV